MSFRLTSWKQVLFSGGMLKARNVIEAGILVVVIGVPVFVCLPLSLTARIIILCFTALPLGLLAIIGIAGESLSSFLFIFLKYLRNRRIVGIETEEGKKTEATQTKAGKKTVTNKKPVIHRQKEMRVKRTGYRRKGEEDFPEEFDEIKSYELRQKLKPAKKKSCKKECRKKDKKQQESKS